MDVITIRVVTRGAVTEEGGNINSRWRIEGVTSIEEAADDRILWEGEEDDGGTSGISFKLDVILICFLFMKFHTVLSTI